MSSSSEERTKALERVLSGVGIEEYGSSYREHCFEIYKTYLAMADQISSRREKANAFFLTVNTALIALLGNGKLATGTDSLVGLELLVPFLGLALCFSWLRIVKSYRDLNSAKFRVVHAIESNLPLRPFDAEWEYVGRGEDPSLYLPFSKIERVVPVLFILFHIVIIGVTVPWSSFEICGQ